jgi:hypothetical protein
VLNGLGGWFIWMLMNDRLTHNQGVAELGLVRLSVLMAFSVSAALFVAGAYAAGIGLAVAALTGRAMLDAPAREWFNR